MQFTAVIEKFDSNLWGFHFVVPADIARVFINGNDRRVICTLNERLKFQCALMPKGDGAFFVNVNKEIRDKLKLKEGTAVHVMMEKDESEYGLPMPEEFEEVLNQDAEGRAHFEALTPGKKRNLLYIAGQPKKSETRITRALVIAEHLKMMNGKIDFKILNASLKGA